MKSIPNIKLTEQEFKYLITSCRVGFGGEATICEGSRSYTLYKLFSKFTLYFFARSIDKSVCHVLFGS